MGRIFLFIGRFKPQEEFIWTEYINFLKFEERLLNAKTEMVQKGLSTSQSFLVGLDRASEEKVRIYSTIYDSMVKQTYSVMQLGWQNDKLDYKGKM